MATKESKEGQGEMFESEDEDDSDEDDEDEDDDDEDDEDKDDEDDEENKEDEDSSDSDSETELTPNEKVEEAERTANKALAEALQINGSGEVKFDSDDDDDMEDDEESMDDEQMLALDDQLAVIFRERRKALTANGVVAVRKSKESAKFNMVTFKARAIDLLEIYIKAQPDSPLILTAVLPLINVIKTSNDKNLADKAHALLKSRLCKVKNLPTLAPSESKAESADGDADLLEEEDPTAPVSAEDLISWLVSIHTIVRKSSRVQLSLACNQASVFLSKVLLTNDIAHTESVVAIYSQTLSDWLLRSSAKTQPALFFEFINWINSARGHLHKNIRQAATSKEKEAHDQEDSDDEMSE